MAKNADDRTGSGQGLISLVIAVLVFGSIWGFFEATLGGFLHLIIFPNKGAIMSSIGVAIMASALAIYGKPGLSVGIGVIAASFKLLDVIIFALPITMNRYYSLYYILYYSLYFRLYYSPYSSLYYCL